MVHPLATLVRNAAAGRFPAVDGGWRRVEPWRAALEAVVCFTGHAVLAVGEDVADARLVELGVDGYGGAGLPRVLTALAGPDGWIDSLDVLLVARAGSYAGVRVVPRPDLAQHPRGAFATRLRDDVRFLGPEDPTSNSVVIISRGVAGLTELSVEIDPILRGAGSGRALIRSALAQLPTGEIVVAAVAPGNAASLRAFLAAGFVPVGSLQLVIPRRILPAWTLGSRYPASGPNSIDGQH